MDRLREHYVLMAHFAQLDANNIVVQVVVVHNNDAPTEQAGIDFLHGLFGPNQTWVQCSYNATMRKNYPGPGYIYDEGRDAFIAPRPYPSWALDESTCRWQPPVPMPETDGLWIWDEAEQQWVERAP